MTSDLRYANQRNIATAKPLIVNVAHLFVLLVFNMLNPPWIIRFQHLFDTAISKQCIDLDPWSPGRGST